MADELLTPVYISTNITNNTNNFAVIHDDNELELLHPNESSNMQQDDNGIAPRNRLLIIACIVTFIFTGALVGLVVGIVKTR